MPQSKSPIQHTQDTDLTHSMAHYLLTIHKLKEERGYARVTDIAKEMELTKGSVSTALSNLKKRELVVEDDAKFISLSSTGHQQVHDILSSRTLLYYLFKDIIGVDPQTAHKDSCLMEHLLSGKTRQALFGFIKQNNSQFDVDLDLSQFEKPEDFYKAQKGDKYLE